MKQSAFFTTLLLMCAVFLTTQLGCRPDTRYHIQISLSNPEAARLLSDVVLFALSAQSYSCGDLLNEPQSAFPHGDVLAREVIEYPLGRGAIRLDRMENVVLWSLGYNRDQVIILSGCTHLDLLPAENVHLYLRLDLVCDFPFVEEILGNQVDDDCNGFIDDCKSDSDCQGYQPCMSGVCTNGECQHIPIEGVCDDGDECTTDDHCESGSCVSSGVDKDKDNDGFVDQECGGQDCDDSNAEIHPDSTEGPSGEARCSDAIDNDCDNLIDLQDSGCEYDGLELVFLGDEDGKFDKKKRELFAEWGFRIHILHQDEEIEEFQRFAGLYDVLFVSQSTNAAKVDDKLPGLAIGIVLEEPGLFDDVLYSSDVRMFQAQEKQIWLSDVGHFITEPFADGDLKVARDGPIEFMFWTAGLPPDAQVLAKRLKTSQKLGLITIERGAALYSNQTASARIVYIPTYRSSPAEWNQDLRRIVRRALMWAGVPE